MPDCGAELRARTVRFLRVVAIVSAVGAAANYAFIARSHPTGVEIAVSLLSGAITGSVITLFEIQAQSRSGSLIRRLPLLISLLVRTVIYGAAFIFPQRLALLALSQFMTVSEREASNLLANRSAYAFIGISLAINLVFILRRLLGAKALVSLVTGRYHRPRAEERIVLFFDLRGSTALAERLGDAAFLNLLNRVFYLITDPVLDSRGEIYRYVGDEVIITWAAEAGLRDAACVTCLFAITDLIASEHDAFVAEFGEAPRLRGALHIGPLMIGVIGDLKTEIVMVGDTMNTTARIEDACRVTGNDYIVSGDLLRRLGGLPAGVVATAIEPIPLRGKELAVDLFALARGDREAVGRVAN